MLDELLIHDNHVYCAHKIITSFLTTNKVAHGTHTHAQVHVFIMDNLAVWVPDIVDGVQSCNSTLLFLDIFLNDVTNSCDPSASRANCFLNTGFNIFASYNEPWLIYQTMLPSLCYRYTIQHRERIWLSWRLGFSRHGEYTTWLQTHLCSLKKQAIIHATSRYWNCFLSLLVNSMFRRDSK